MKKYSGQIAFSANGKGLWFPMGYMTSIRLFVFLNLYYVQILC